MRFKRGPLSQRIPQVFGRCQPSDHVDLSERDAYRAGRRENG
jgi:hypothetical protein